MASRRPASPPTRRTRLPWTVFAVVATLAIGGCLVVAARTGDPADLVLTLVGSLIVLGIAAALMQAIVSPSLDGPPTRRGRGGGWEAGGYGGTFDGGGGDSGGGGGSGGD